MLELGDKKMSGVLKLEHKTSCGGEVEAAMVGGGGNSGFAFFFFILIIFLNLIKVCFFLKKVMKMTKMPLI